MKNGLLLLITWLVLFLGAMDCFAYGAENKADEQRDGTAAKGFAVGNGQFLLNGRPFQVKAAELHYPRIPRPYWDNRIKLCKALGMNTICMYVFWNVHEQRPDEFEFTGQNDIREFVKLCQANDMMVILRPGPYVCAEWEMGGLPWWLLKEEDIRLRENDPYFLERVDKFEQKVAEQLGDLTVQNGGPIIMVQVENEYGSYGIDKQYIANIRDIIRKHFGNEITLFQCDWSSNFQDNGLDDLLWTINFGTGADINRQFSKLREVRPDSPLMCSEYWSGWFDKWGANHETRSADEMVAGIEEMLDKNISFSLYMTHGGTNWGHWAGANPPGYAPDVTSYDYDAPISESGQITPKYLKLRETLAKYTESGKLPAIPKTIDAMSVPEFTFTEYAPLFDNLPEGKKDKDIHPMEYYDQGYGSILYRTHMPEMLFRTTLTVNEPHDYAQVFLDGKYVGSLDRREGETKLSLPPSRYGATLDILVEATGRINFGRSINDRKGIPGNVTVTDRRVKHNFVCDLKDWTVYNLVDSPEFYASAKFQPLDSTKAAEYKRLPRGLYRGKFTVNKTDDTFLNFETWGKGLVYVNGHPIGRIWEIGPQQTLYVPGCWLHKGENEVIVFDIVGPREAKSEGLSKPVLDKLQDANNGLRPYGAFHADFTDEKPDYVGSFCSGIGLQKVIFDNPIKGRFLCLEAVNSISGEEIAAIAEMYVLDKDKNYMPRDHWKTIFADSDDKNDGIHTSDKVIDMQESTYWGTEKGKPYPHSIVIDLGDSVNIGGFEYLPNQNSRNTGAIKNFNIYIRDNTDFLTKGVFFDYYEPGIEVLYDGGLYKWLQDNIRIPEGLSKKEKVVLGLIIEPNGLVSNIEVARPCDIDEINEEAKRLASIMPLKVTYYDHNPVRPLHWFIPIIFEK